MSAEIILTKATDDNRRLISAMASQSALVKKLWRERDHLVQAISRFMPYAIGPEDQDSEGYAEAVAAVQEAIKTYSNK